MSFWRLRLDLRKKGADACIGPGLEGCFSILKGGHLSDRLGFLATLPLRGGLIGLFRFFWGMWLDVLRGRRKASVFAVAVLRGLCFGGPGGAGEWVLGCGIMDVRFQRGIRIV